MAKPLHIGSEFILSVVEGIFDILFIFISTLSSAFRPLPSVFCPLSSVICPLSSDICPKGSTNFDKLCKTNPICGKDGNAPTSLLLTTNDQRLATREAQNKPKQTQFLRPTNVNLGNLRNPWIKKYKDKSHYPWSYWGTYYNDVIVPYLKRKPKDKPKSKEKEGTENLRFMRV